MKPGKLKKQGFKARRDQGKYELAGLSRPCNGHFCWGPHMGFGWWSGFAVSLDEGSAWRRNGEVNCRLVLRSIMDGGIFCGCVVSFWSKSSLFGAERTVLDRKKKGEPFSCLYEKDGACGSQDRRRQNPRYYKKYFSPKRNISLVLIMC